MCAPRRRPPRRGSSCRISLELQAGLTRLRRLLDGSVRRALARDRERLDRDGARLRAAPRLLLERRRVALDHAAARLQALSPRATLARGYAVVRAGGAALRESATVAPATPLEIELASGSLGATVDRGAAVSVGGPEREPSFEELRRELEEIVGRLERGDVGVDEAIELWQRGEALHRRCVELLEAAEGRIEELGAEPEG